MTYGYDQKQFQQPNQRMGNYRSLSGPPGLYSQKSLKKSPVWKEPRKSLERTFSDFFDTFSRLSRHFFQTFSGDLVFRLFGKSRAYRARETLVAHWGVGNWQRKRGSAKKESRTWFATPPHPLSLGTCMHDLQPKGVREPRSGSFTENS